MLKKELALGIIEYIFEPKHGQYFGNKITALISEGKVILIDVGYEHQAIEVMKDLDANHLEIEKIIITHFHNDHMQGLRVLPEVCVYGSSYYNITLDMWTPKEEHKYFTPSILVEDTLKIQFGRHEIEMIKFPGHSICTMLVKINDTYIHIADELMFSNNGEALLPSITKEGVERHFQSINRLREYVGYIFILGHGYSIEDKSKIENAIDNASLYLNEILCSSNRITVDVATKACTCIFLHKEWHENVYE